MKESLIESFYEETHELLDNMETYLIKLEDDPNNQDLIKNVFRILHSIKGTAAMFGFTRASSFAHEIESVFDFIKKTEQNIDKEIIDAFLDAKDFLHRLLDSPGTISEEEEKSICLALNNFKSNYFDLDKTPEKTIFVSDTKKRILNLKKSTTYKIVYTASQNIFKRGLLPEHIINELLTFGETTVSINYQTIPRITNLNPEDCYLSWTILLTSQKSIKEVNDIFLFDKENVQIDIVDTNQIINGNEVKKLGEIISVKSPHYNENIEEALQKQNRQLGEILVNDLGASQKLIDDALMEQKHVQSLISKENESLDKTIRINSERLDRLLNFAGELITAQAQLSQEIKTLQNKKLNIISDKVKQLAEELRSTAMELRLVPIDSMLNRFKRLIRDLAKNLNKKIELHIDSSNIEIDKSVTDALYEPILHLLRNSADHGIETEEERQKAKKNLTGQITISAKNMGFYIQIIIKDDGRGIDKEKLLQKAIEKNIINQNTVLDEQQINSLIFTTGFSTSEKISNISGRGIGMDVVKNAINNLGGTLSIKSELNKGTEFCMNIPLTLVIIDGFLTSVGDYKYILPITNIEACYHSKKNKSKFINYKNEHLPYFSGKELFDYGTKESTPNEEEIIIINTFEKKMAIGFDQIYGRYQAVIKPIGELSKYCTPISGATILPDGSIALIIDILALSQHK